MQPDSLSPPGVSPVSPVNSRSPLARAAADLIDRLTHLRGVWQTPARIARALRRDEESTTDLLAELDLAGWIIVHPDGPEPLISLSTRAAARCGVTPRVADGHDRASWMRLDAEPNVEQRDRNRRPHLVEATLTRRPERAANNGSPHARRDPSASRPKTAPPLPNPRRSQAARPQTATGVAQNPAPASPRRAPDVHSPTSFVPGSSPAKARS